MTTRASPEQVLEALTDFTDRRVKIWSSTLDPDTYEVRALGDTWAVARESTTGSPFWVVSRYDWSDPRGQVDGRGVQLGRVWRGFSPGRPFRRRRSLVLAEWTYTGANRTRDKVMLSLLGRAPLRRLIAREWAKTLDRHAQPGLA